MDREALKIRLNEHLDFVKEKGYNPIYLGLYGSQNYSLDYEYSDVDTKAIVIPTFEELVFNTSPVSTELELPNGEHCDVKDIRLMFNNFRKQNINFIEIIFTPFFIVSEFAADEMYCLRGLGEDIARFNPKKAIDCMAGMAQQKFCALEKEFPSKLEVLEMYGYDPKQLHHIVRLREFMERYINGESFQNCLISGHKEYLLRIKMGEFPLEAARQIAKVEMEKIKLLKEEFEKKNHEVNEQVDAQLDELVLKILKKQFNIN